MTAQPSDPGTAHPEPGVRRVADVQLRGRAGPLPARAYWPPAAAPALLVLLPTGGGRDGVERADDRGRALSAHLGAVVLSVGYRPPPSGDAAVEDAVTATRWAEDHATELGAGPGRLIVAGEGSGAGPALAVALRARDEGWPPLARLILVRPEPGPELVDGPAGILDGLAAVTVVGTGSGVAARLRSAGVEVDEVPAPAAPESREGVRWG